MNLEVKFIYYLAGKVGDVDNIIQSVRWQIHRRG